MENKTNKCNWLSKKLMECRFKKINNTDYCRHHQYVNNYTEEMKKNSLPCLGCFNNKYLGEHHLCEKCRIKEEIKNNK